MASSNTNIYLTDVRTYIAGVLMPTMSVQINCTFNQPPSAAITLPPCQELYALGAMDRVPVHIFVRETMVECPEFILMFEGFISGRQYVSSATMKSITVNAVSYMDILDDVHVSFLTSQDDMFLPTAAGQNDISLQLIMPNLVFPNFLFQKGLNSSERIRTPSEYLENIYSYIQNGGSESSPAKGLHDSELAKYYAKVASDLKLLDRFVKLPYFDVDGSDGTAWGLAGFDAGDDRATCFPMIYGMQAQAAMDQLMGSAREAAHTQSMRELLDFLVEEMEYEYLHVSNPMYSGGRLISSCLKPIFNDAMPPRCNVIHAPLVSSISSSSTYKGVPTRIQVNNLYSPLQQLARVHQGVSDQLTKAGTLDYYPSEKFNFFEGSGDTRRALSAELLKSETFTGPWVQKVGTPRWFSYLANNPAYTDVNGVTDSSGAVAPAEKVFKERFCRRQLLSAKYLRRQLTVEGMFNPYVTPGFPGVVFDGSGSNMAFAGHVVMVSHSITPTNVATTVGMNFVRLLDEAVSHRIPNPLSCLDEIVKSQSRMSEIYSAILGGPGSVAETFEAIRNEYKFGAKSIDSPHCNPQEAYRYQRRSICTFEDYTSFMGFRPIPGEGPEGPETPMRMMGDFLSARRNLTYYIREVLEMDTVPPKEENAPGNASEQQSPQPVISERTSGVCDLLSEIARREFSNIMYI